MEANNFRFESHVAQQSRRDKLRINQQNSDHFHQDYNTNMENSVFHASGMLNFASGQSCGWIDDDNNNYSTNSTGVETNIQNSILVKPNCYGYQDSSNENSAHFHYNVSHIYQNTLQEVVTGRGSWATGQNDSNEHLLLPTYGYQSDPVRVTGISNWVNRQQVLVSDPPNTQGLSLSLSSSVPSTKAHENLRPDPNNHKPGYANRVWGGTRTDGFSHPNTTGPLGPFTGYATILKNSKYIKPTQQMLIEFCSSNGSKTINTHEMYSDMIKEVNGGADESIGGDSGGSLSNFYGTNEINDEVDESCRPEYQQKKAKLLYMQEEVCKKYKQYHQQLQMVVSAFESVAGLSMATPYISQALKAVSRHFRCLKNAISDQLRHHIKRSNGEELVSHTNGGDASTCSRLKYGDHSFNKSALGFFEPQPPIWRPQRGLPERAVAVLRAWLFDHFLHPYPTDTDKHMLATQTGLTRNQGAFGLRNCIYKFKVWKTHACPKDFTVSNWFINARVRVWKPMVEEIHTLETKGSAEPNPNRPPPYGSDQPGNRLHKMPNEQAEYSGIGCSSLNFLAEPSQQIWNQEKRSRVDRQLAPGQMDGSSFLGFVPYQQSGLGAVSLTLGLRQSADISHAATRASN